MPDRHTTIRASQLRNFSITAEDLAANSITEDKLVITNDPFDDGYLKYNTTSSGMEWSTISGGASLAPGTDNHVVRYDGTDALQSSDVEITDAGNIIVGESFIGEIGTGYAGFSHIGNNSYSDYAILQNASGQTFINSSTGQKVRFSINNTEIAYIDNGGLAIKSGYVLGFALGTTINELSIDGTLSDNSDNAVPTEKAVKTYVDNNVVDSTLEVEYFTLDSTDISNKYVTLAHSPISVTEISLDVIKGCAQFYGDDYTVSGTQVGWNGLGLDGILEASDELRIMYMY